jgi:hypothetical protein
MMKGHALSSIDADAASIRAGMQLTATVITMAVKFDRG